MRIDLQSLRAGEIGDVEYFLPGDDQVRAWLLPDNAALHAPTGIMHLVIVLDGRAEIRSGDGSWRLGARRWLLLGRDVAPLVRAVGAARVICAVANPVVLADIDPGALLIAPQVGRVGLAAWRNLLALQQELGRPSESARIEQFLSRLVDCGECDHGLLMRAPGRTQARRRQLLGRMLRARMFIEGNPERVVRIAELARLCNFSPWHFTKTFHHIFGETPQSYGARVRLQRAHDLVLRSRLAISEIAAACGFENASSFARAFHERFGESASRLRARRLQPATQLRELGS